MHKGFLITGAILGAVAVCLGAFGAHALKTMLPGNDTISFDTGVRYQMYHIFALLITGVLFKEFNHKFLLWAGRLFIAGIILFSGSLYLLTALKIYGISGFRWLGAVTPFGGIIFVLAWLLLAFSVAKKLSINFPFKRN
jgi:uncharacterized membrane protein YgdD (TMEM256/DUF423 family)